MTPYCFYNVDSELMSQKKNSQTSGVGTKLITNTHTDTSAKYCCSSNNNNYNGAKCISKCLFINPLCAHMFEKSTDSLPGCWQLKDKKNSVNIFFKIR